MKPGGLQQRWELPLEVRLRRLLQGRERTWIVLWLAACALLLGWLAWWGVAKGGLERMVEQRMARWPERLAEAEALVAAGRFDEASRSLADLDRRFPARSVKHRFDRERERLLAALGRSHMELGRKGRALEVLERLARFDGRNYANHVLLAEACERFGEGERAAEAYGAALVLHPNHLPAVQALAELHFAGGRFGEALQVVERYLDAFLLARLRLVAGDGEAAIELLADGRTREVETHIEVPKGWSGELCLESAGYSLRLEVLELDPPLRAGVAGRSEGLVLGPAGWSARDASEMAPGSWAAVGPSSALCRSVEAPSGVVRARVRLAVFKALPPELWMLAETCYRNNLRHEGLAQASARTLVGGCLEAGSLFLD